MSLYALTYHIVFGTYCRQQVINIEHERELYKFINNFSKERGVFVRRIGGLPDHVHLLCDIPPKNAVADFVKLLKAETSKFMRVNPHFPFWQGWSAGYGAFTVDASLRSVRLEYIKNQKAHHGAVTFEDEYRALLAEAEVAYDENRLFED